MRTIEELYNEIISCPPKWIYWDYDDNKVEDIKKSFKKKSRDICKLFEIDISNNIMSFNLLKFEDYKVGDIYKNIVTSLNNWLIDVNLNSLSIDFSIIAQ